MIIGIPKEIKSNEYRVAVRPSGVREFVTRGHKVLIEQFAGAGSGFSDDEYLEAGAIILSAAEIYSQADMIYKVKEILPAEYDLLTEGQVIFTYLHSNANLEMTNVLLNKKVIGIAYEDIVDDQGQYPLLKPMSEIAGKGGFLAALQFMQSIYGGRGVMLSRIPGVETPKVTIIGAGNAGVGAAELASAFGNQVTVLDIDLAKLESAKYKLPLNVEFLYSDRSNLEKCLKQSDVMINCLLWDKTRNDHLVYREDLLLMKPGSLIVDVSCDSSGAFETSQPTSHDKPVYTENGILHYAVDNVPAAYARTATIALTNTTLPYAIDIAEKGCQRALVENPNLRKGLSFYAGCLTLQETALKHQSSYSSPESVLGIA
jgi:alanine dehydrogenase